MDASSAIYVRNVVKRYGDIPILDGFSMTVQRGTIYGLLGSSGCGKTTLLNCIVGRKSIESGEIWVLGAPKGNEVLGPKVGYMPQELALVEEFTVRDAIYYFGTIFNMKNKEINDRLAVLTDLLDLPPEDRFLKNCSGGQKRRVSLAVALVHNPELLILDEPTVGIDPILREKIWDYLKHQVTQNKVTVVITTHYIEETKDANRIGLMRGGKLLIEEAPYNLLATYQTDTLEEVFLLLSQKQEREEESHAITDDSLQSGSDSVSSATSVASFAIGYGSQDELTKSSNKKKGKVNARYMSAVNLNKNRMKALLAKNWKQFYRNVGGMLFMVGFPIMQIWFYINSVGRDPTGLNLGIVNNESFTTLCNDSAWNKNRTALLRDYECNFKDLTCLYLTYLEDPMINKILYQSVSEALEGIKHGNIVGALYIPSNFTETFEERELTKSSNKKKGKVNARYMSAVNLNKNRMKALLAKNWKQFYRNVGGMLFMVGFPIMQIWFYINSVGRDPTGLNLGIVNNESFTTLCNDSAWNKNRTALLRDYECNFKDLTCLYLTYLEDPMINKILYQSVSEALEGIKHGNIVGALYIPSNFTETFEERMRLGADAQKWITDYGEMKVYMDMSNRLIGPYLVSRLSRLFFDFQKKIFSDCELPEKLAGIPIKQHFIYGDDTQAMTTVFTPAVVVTFLYFLGSSMTANILVKEKIDGVWDRSIVAGVSSLEITLSHLLLEGAIMFLQSLETLIWLLYGLDTEHAGYFPTMFLLMYLQGICGMSFGLFISSFSNSFSQANVLCTGGYLPMLLIAGVIWPIEAMPTFLRIFSLGLPCTIPILSFRNALVKGWPLLDLEVLNGAGISIVWISVFVIASVWIIKIKN